MITGLLRFAAACISLLTLGLAPQMASARQTTWVAQSTLQRRPATVPRGSFQADSYQRPLRVHLSVGLSKGRRETTDIYLGYQGETPKFEPARPLHRRLHPARVTEWKADITEQERPGHLTERDLRAASGLFSRLLGMTVYTVDKGRPGTHEIRKVAIAPGARRARVYFEGESLIQRIKTMLGRRNTLVLEQDAAVQAREHLDAAN